MTYFEKLKDPRWQKLSATVKECAGWKCERCGDDSNNLQAHHKLYRGGAEPWDYSPDELECLCEECHKRVTFLIKKLRWCIADLSTDQLVHLLFKLLTDERFGGVKLSKAEKREFFNHWKR